GWQPRKPDLETIIADAWAWMQAYPQGYPDEGGELPPAGSIGEAPRQPQRELRGLPGNAPPPRVPLPLRLPGALLGGVATEADRAQQFVASPRIEVGQEHQRGLVDPLDRRDCVQPVAVQEAQHPGAQVQLLNRWLQAAPHLTPELLH